MAFLSRPALTLGGLTLLCLAACAGTPPGGTANSKVAAKKCVHTTGSFFCDSGEDQPLGSLNDPSLGQPQIYGGGGLPPPGGGSK